MRAADLRLEILPRPARPFQSIEMRSVCHDPGALTGLGLFSLDPLVDLFTVHGHVSGRIHADPNLVSLDSQYCHSDFVTNHKSFANPASQD
jgi:hypothetical protein